MLLHLAVPVGRINPVGVGDSVPVLQEIVLGESAGLGHILDIFLGVKHFRSLCEGLDGPLEVVGNLAFALFAPLGGDEYDAVSCFSTVDGG